MQGNPLPTEIMNNTRGGPEGEIGERGYWGPTIFTCFDHFYQKVPLLRVTRHLQPKNIQYIF